jgi:hypothetical protein
MFQPRSVPGTRRRGVILLVVISLLTLFAAVGVAFVLYADAGATSARLFREAQARTTADLEPEFLLAHFLGRLIYDVPDDEGGVYCGLRGHSLARSVYGYNDAALNATSFNGTGRLHGPSVFATDPAARAEAKDDYRLVNYTYFARDGFLRDPERLGWRADLTRPRGLYTGGFNAPYTYPDLNNLYLAAVKADGTVLLPSFHRPWLFGSNDPDRNPNWINKEGKYLLLRPRPVDHVNPATGKYSFPYPADDGGDVKNLIGSPGGNDSYWLDLGFPVMVTADGRKFKPLFAPLVVDLDGRVNLNVHGNVRASDPRGRPAHASGQGWGPWEVSLQHVLGQQTHGIFEWPNLFAGTQRPLLNGRYGRDGKPGVAGTEAPAGPLLHFYAQGDLDGCEVQGGRYINTRGRMQLPGSGAPPTQAFPSYPAGYGNGSGGRLGERWEHPQLYNLTQLTGGDRLFAASNLEALLRFGDTGSAALGSELFRLCPQNFADARARRLVTTHSNDIDQPGLTPWVYDPDQYPYQFAAADQAPQGDAIPFPGLDLRKVPVPAHSEFGAPGLAADAAGVDWRAVTTSLGRLDLNRRLTPYPLPSPQTRATYQNRFDTPERAEQFQQAQQERKNLADDIYNRLLSVTGVPRSGKVPNQPTAEELRVRRWLAQLAVNIVEYLDEDDISTPFNFYTTSDAQGLPFDPGAVAQSGSPPKDDPELPKYWVFGTELPHVVVNEVLAEYKEEQSPQPGVPGPTTVKVWVELHNPFQAVSDPALQAQDGFPVRLRADEADDAVTKKPQAYAPYRVVLATGVLARPFNDNVLGKPAQVRAQTTDQDFDGPVPTAGGGVQPPQGPVASPYLDLKGGQTDNPFFLLGPPGGDARNTLRPPPRGTVPASTPWLKTASLSYRHTFDPLQPEERAQGLTVLLRRLANPHLPFDPNPTVKDANGDIQPNPWYNPYLTVDYLDNIPLQDQAQQSTYASQGKLQPYAAHPTQVAGQVSPRPRQKTQHTFGLPNNPLPLSGHYDWLVHLDRQLISPVELLHVSAFPPYQLTQHFITGDDRRADQKFRHYAPWADQARRLYRIFEFFEASGRSAGAPSSQGGRVAGRVNLNTVWDPEVFRALCDPQAGNGFTLADVNQVFDQLLKSRSPGLTTGRLGENDRPFRGQAAGYTPADDAQFPGGGIGDTLLRTDPDDPGRRLLEPQPRAVDPAHPYVKAELLTKVFSNVTTRSNVFAVWLTVGFFEVVADADPKTGQPLRPVILGAEIGIAEGRQVRHRMFAIVDRTALDSNPGPQPRFDPRQDPAVLYFSLID